MADSGDEEMRGDSSEEYSEEFSPSLEPYISLGDYYTQTAYVIPQEMYDLRSDNLRLDTGCQCGSAFGSPRCRYPETPLEGTVREQDFWFDPSNEMYESKKKSPKRKSYDLRRNSHNFSGVDLCCLIGCTESYTNPNKMTVEMARVLLPLVPSGQFSLRDSDEDVRRACEPAYCSSPSVQMPESSQNIQEDCGVCCNQRIPQHAYRPDLLSGDLELISV